ncbi:cytochrome P450 [Ganoderma sinense ZZ0214-1]|uniref:Cytochrome P450 n=1 Tax=Ganoderma sinense ZZ0214-1 TaxID=1077348 RepID=A0A2G8S1U0_9APHY|nr:cytochrome P450 [Ganoderma sinense ZZ0214-1]
MAISLPVAAFLTAAVYVIWKVFLRNLIVPSVFNWKNLPGPESPSWLGGHLEALFNRQGWKYWKWLADTYGTSFLVSGPMGEQILIIHDPKAMHSVLIKDVENYPKRTLPSDDFMIFLGPGLLTTEGQQHRRQRKMLNPVFSAAHLRHMNGLFHDITDKLRAGIEKRVNKDSWQPVDVNGWMARTTLEMLGQAGLGYSFDNFVEDSSDAYGESLKNFFPVMARLSLTGYVVRELTRFLPDNAIRAILRRAPHADTRRMMEISDTMIRRSKEIIDQKKEALSKGDEALAHQVGEGKDIMSILLRANMNATAAEKLPDEELVAQMSILMLAGMDTTSNALSRTLQILASNPEAQAKLRAEVLEARNGEPFIDYENIVKLPYLDAVCRETLRLHSPVHLVPRRSAKNMALPLLHPVRGKDGREMSEITIPQNTLLLLNFQGSNYNTELWGDDAHEWKPERWLKPAPTALEEARMPGVYSNIMSFSGGTRSCIGFKFSQLEMKVVLSVILSAFEFELTEKEITWNFGAVTFPTMGLDSEKPEMVLNVRAL